MKRTILFAICTLCSALLFSKVPENIRILPGTVASTEAIVFWDRPDDYKNIKHYAILVDGHKVGISDKNSFRMVNLEPDRLYSVAVNAVPTKGKERFGSTITFKTNPTPQLFNVKDYGAKGDGKTLDTKAIQQAIDECTPHGEVIIPSGEYITGALFIQKNDISIKLEKGATLKAVHNLGHFPLIKSRYEGWPVEIYTSVVNIGKLEGYKRYSNIRIYGGGVIDNQGGVLADIQTKMLSRMSRSRGLPIVNCDNVALDNITVQNPGTWNVHPLLCNGITTYECFLYSADSGVSNGDSWNPDSSSDCYLLNSVMDGQDDNVAIKSVSYTEPDGRVVHKASENIHVNFCRIIRGGGLVVGVEMGAGVRNVWFTDCIIENSDRGFLVCSRQDGPAVVENIHFRDIEVIRTGCWGINVTMWYWIPSYKPGTLNPDEVRKMRNITFENIHIKHADGNPIQILGVAEQPMSNISFKNVTIESSEYDVLLRHCNNVSFENVKVGERYWILDHAENVNVDRKTSKRRAMSYPYKLVDPNATYRTKALYANLHKISSSGRFLFGAQDATASGYGWHDNSGKSDIERVAGKTPVFYSWDFMHIARPGINTGMQEDNEKVRRLTCQAFYDGGINSYCWHAMNPVTGGSFYDTTAKVVPQILPGGKYHDKLIAMLDQIADYNKTLIGKNGEHIPIIFRPWHEFDGSWFWWGKNHCTAEEFKELYRFTVSYLRDTCSIRNFIYAFSPDINFTNTEEYLERYPGDEYVDIIAMDNYWDFRFEETNHDLAHMRLKVISDYAKATGKVAALAEAGQAAIDDAKWFTDRLLKAIYGYPTEEVRLAYVALWRNSVIGFFSPYIGHPATANFLEFLEDDRVILGDPYDWLNKYYHLTD